MRHPATEPALGVSLGAMDAEPGEEIFFRGHASWRSMVPFYVKGMLVSLVIGVAAGVASRAAGRHVDAGWVIVAVLIPFLLALAIGHVRRLRNTYFITSQRLTIETGLVSRDLHQARLERIQNVNSRQSLFERALRVGTVDFDTAGESQFDFAFSGVAHPRWIVSTVDWALSALRGAQTPDV